MPIRRQSIKSRFEVMLGVDNTTVPGSKRTDGTLSEALNADLVGDSIVVKRKGYKKVNNTIGSGIRRTRAGFDYSPSVGLRETLLYSEDSLPTGVTGVLSKLNGANAPTVIKTNLPDNIKPSIVQFRNLAFIFSKYSNLVYDGTATRQIGITSTNTAPTFNALTNGDLTTTSNYLFAYTYYNSDTGAESTPSPASTEINTGDTDNDGLIINVNPGSSDLGDQIRVYRSFAGGSLLFFEGDTSITATTYTSIKSDASLGHQLETDNSRLAEPGQYAISLDNRLFVAGFQNNPSRVQYSKIGQDGAMPESFQATDFVDCNLNDGDEIIGLHAVNDTIIVLKQRSIGRLVRITNNFVQFETVGSQKYIYEEISNEITGISHHTMVQVDNILTWLGKDDIYGTDGVRVVRFGKRIRKTIQKLNFNQSHKFSVINKKDTQQIIFSVCTSGKVECDFQLVGHYRDDVRYAWTFYSAGPDINTHPGLFAASLFEVVDGNVVKYYFGSGNDDGYIYQFDIGTSDDSNGIYFDVRLPWESYKNASTYKLFHSYFMFAVGSGKAYNITRTFEADHDNTTLVTDTASITTGNNAVWSAVNWAEFNWASLKYERTSFHPHCRVFFGRFGFQNFNADEPIAVKGLAGTAIIDPLS